MPSKNEKWKQWAFPFSCPLFKDSSEQLHMRWNLRLCYVQSDWIEETSWGTCFWLFQVFFYSIVMVFVMELTKKISLPGKRKGKNICLSVTTLYRVYQSFLLLVIDSFSKYLFDDFCKRHNVHRKLIGAEVGPYTGYNGGLNNSHMRRVNCIIFHFQSKIIYLLLLF